jgi:hypothetical protein
MQSQSTDQLQDRSDQILSLEQAEELIFALGSPDPISVIKLLLPLRKLTKEPMVEAAMYQIMGAAFSLSICYSDALEDYIAAIEEGRDPDEEARERLQRQKAEAGQMPNAADEGAEKERRQ